MVDLLGLLDLAWEKLLDVLELWEDPADSSGCWRYAPFLRSLVLGEFLGLAAVLHVIG